MLQSIGRRRKGSVFLVFALTSMGVGTIVQAISSSNDDVCSNCIDEGSTGQGWVVAEVAIGAGLLALSLNTTLRNSPRNVVRKVEVGNC